MALERLKFTKDWTSPADFPTVETDETTVRRDLQLLHSETRDHINEVLLPAIEEEYVPGTRMVNGHPLSENVTVTRADLGLGNVDNTSDMDKPVSTAQAAAIQAAVMGAIPDGSVSMAALDTAVAAAVERAEEGGQLDEKMEALAAEQADLFHAAQHASGGSDPITPAAIGAVPLSGSVAMTGNLYIKKAPGVTVMLQDTTSNTRGVIQMWGNAIAIQSQNIAGDGTNLRQLTITNSNTTALKNALRFVDIVDGKSTQYDILHTGNLSEYVSARTAVIDYTGTGSTSVSLAVGFAPKLAVVQQVTDDSPATFPLMLTHAGTALGLRCMDSSGETEAFDVEVTEFGETVSWACSDRVEANNSTGDQYRLIAVG